MYNIPVFYDYQNVYDSIIQPSSIHVHDSALSRYFRRYLLMKTLSVFKWKLPENWNSDYFLYILYCIGFICVVNTDKFGIIPQQCSLNGYGVYYQPTNAIVTNPLLNGIKSLRIGTQTELIKLNHDYGGILDIINFYADIMALSAETAGTNLLNCKLAYLFACGNKSAAESFKKVYDNFASGEGCVVFDKGLLDEQGKLNFQMFNQNLKNTYIAGDILTDLKKYEDDFLTLIGIPNANTDKKERLITDEVNSNNIEVKTLASQWLENLQNCCKKVNKMFGLSLSVDWRFNDAEEVEADEINPQLVRAL